jgi:hypothetical protein
MRAGVCGAVRANGCTGMGWVGMWAAGGGVLDNTTLVHQKSTLLPRPIIPKRQVPSKHLTKSIVVEL